MSIILTFFLYITAISASCSFLYCYEKSKKRYKRIFIIFALLIPSLLATFRQSGIDTNTYSIIFDEIHNNHAYNYPIEYGWRILNILSPNFKWLLFISALLFSSFSFFAIKNVCKTNIWLAWLTFLVTCYFIFYNGMRQMIAASIGFWGIVHLLKKHKIKFVLSVILAILFHKTAIVLICVPIIPFFLSKYRYFEILVLIIAILLFVAAPIIVNIISKLIGDTYAQLQYNISLGFLLYSIPPILPYYYIMYVDKYNKLKPCSILYKNVIFIKKIYSLYFFLIPMHVLGFAIPYLDRFAWYFQIFLVLLVPLMINFFEKRSRNILIFLFICWFFLYHLIMGVVLNGNGIYPYC